MARYQREKKPMGKIAVMLMLIVLSLLIVASLYAIRAGIIPSPFGGEDAAEVPVSGEPQSSAEPQKPPELVVNDNGVFNGEKLDELRKLLSKNAFSVSIYYRDIASGAELSFNAGKKYQAGSVIKAPYCKWLISSGADLTKPLAITEKSVIEGGGKTKESPIGTEFTVSELIDAALIYSDNTAYNMLTQEFGFDGFLGYAKNLGVYANQSAGNIFGNMSASGAGQFFADIYRYSLDSPEASEQLLYDMKNTNYLKQIPDALSGIEVAHKYGYNGGNYGFHDAAIVYADSPYILTIFTTLNPDKGGTVEYIQSVARLVNEIHNKT